MLIKASRKFQEQAQYLFKSRGSLYRRTQGRTSSMGQKSDRTRCDP